MRFIVNRAGARFLCAFLVACVAISGQVLLRAQALEPAALPPGKGKDLLNTACTQCHALRPIVMLRDGAPGWRNFVHEMVLRGAQLSPEEAETLVAYLAEHLGPGKKLSPGPEGAKTVSLPPGAGKDLVETRCGTCHDLGRVATVKRTQAEWESITKNMIERGAPIKPEEAPTIVSYLSSAFGK